MNNPGVGNVGQGNAANQIVIPSQVTEKPITCCRYLDKIIDKKIHLIALTCFERFVDLICRFFYCTYRNAFNARIKIIPFPNGQSAKLYNHTNKIVSIGSYQTPVGFLDVIWLNNNPVKFCNDVYFNNPNGFIGDDSCQNAPTYFGTQYHTDRVIIHSHPTRDDHVRVTEYQTGNLPARAWTVDLRATQHYQVTELYGPQPHFKAIEGHYN